jgi:ribosomal protein L37E
MAQGMKGNQVRCVCRTCGRHSFRVHRPDVVSDENAGWGLCRRLHDGQACGGRLEPKRRVAEEVRMAKARADYEALNS